MIAFLIGRGCRYVAVVAALFCSILACGIARPASAQVRIDVPFAPADESPICLYNFAIVVSQDDECGAGFAGEDPEPETRGLMFGPGNDGSTLTYLSANGDAYFRHYLEIDGDTLVTGTIEIDNGLKLYGGLNSREGITNRMGFNNGGGIVNTGGITSSGAFVNNGTFTNNGNLTVRDNLSTDTFNANSAQIAGYMVVGGVLTANGGIDARGGRTDLGEVVVSQSLRLTAGTSVDMGGNRIQNVGAPVAATDAANKAYVDAAVGTAVGNANALGQDTAAALGGGSTYNAATGHLSAPTYKVGTTNYNNVGSALNAANTSGLAYFHTNSTKADSSATGTDSTAIGPASSASGAGSFAAGNGAIASANGAVAVGQASKATGVNAVAIGNGATATGSVAVGAGASAANGGAAYGDRSTATGVNAAALGPDASAVADNAVAIGSGSSATTANTVSFGNSTNTRRLVNVAAGVSSSDAATVGQLQAGGASTAAALGGGSTVRADGTITAPSYSIAGNTYNNVGSAFSGVVALSYDIRNEARRGIAATTAMGVAPMPSEPGRTSWVANTAIFRGEVGYGASIAHRFDTKTPLAVTAGFAYSRGGNSIGRVGMAGEF